MIHKFELEFLEKEPWYEAWVLLVQSEAEAKALQPLVVVEMSSFVENFLVKTEAVLLVVQFCLWTLFLEIQPMFYFFFLFLYFFLFSISNNPDVN